MPNIDAKKICLIRTSAIGDTVHALSFVNGLRNGYPDAHLTWVLQTFPYELVKHQPGIDRFITFDRKGGPKDWISLFSQLRSERFDMVIVPQISAKASLLTFFTPAAVRLGFDFKRGRPLHWLITNRHIPPRPMGHSQGQLFEFLEYLGIKNFPIEWNFTFTAEERSWQQKIFDAIGRPVIGFVVATAHREKDWQAQKYIRVMDYAHETLNMQSMIIGGPGAAERRMTDEILGGCRSEPIVALEDSIRRMMLRLDGCRLVVSPDTAPLHVAVALDVPTIGLYGYTNPRRCGPYNKFLDLLIDKYNDPGEENAPINRSTRAGRMPSITAEEVIEKIELGLNRYPRKHRYKQMVR